MSDSDKTPLVKAVLGAVLEIQRLERQAVALAEENAHLRAGRRIAEDRVALAEDGKSVLQQNVAALHDTLSDLRAENARLEHDRSDLLRERGQLLVAAKAVFDAHVRYADAEDDSQEEYDSEVARDVAIMKLGDVMDACGPVVTN